MSGRVLVTGAGGFIGSHLVEALVQRGYQVRAFVRYNGRGDAGLLETLPPQLLDGVEIVRGDLKDGEAVRGAVRGCEVVYHLGALIAIPYSYVHPNDFVQTNVVGTANVLNACRESDALRKLVHTSTSEVYGTARTVPIPETHPLQAQSPYAASKIAADKLAESYFLSFELPVATIRPFNTYGPRQSARAVIPTIMTQMLTGGVVKLGRLTPTRDLTFVKDTARAFVAIAEEPRTIGQTINVGSGHEIAIGALFERIRRIAGVEARIEVEAERIRPDQSEVERLCADTTLARQLVGWQPQCSLDGGLEVTLAWVRENLARYRPGRYSV